MTRGVGLIAGVVMMSICSWGGPFGAQAEQTQKPQTTQQSDQPAQKPQGGLEPQQSAQKPQSGQASQPTKKPAMRKPVPLQIFTGVISDGQCAPKGSHKEVMKKASVNTPANCVKGCARRYGYVLYDPATRKVYKLNDQERPAELAARKVKIKGALDKTTQTIYVSNIEPAR